MNMLHKHYPLFIRCTVDEKMQRQDEIIKKTGKDVASIAAEPTDHSARDDSWDREHDSTILKINTSAYVGKTVEEAIAQWLSDAECDSGNTRLEGPNIGKNYTIQFLGNAIVAARQAKKA